MTRLESSFEKPDPQGEKALLAADDDLPLVTRILAGDRRAFESLVRKHERRVFRVTMAVLGNAEDAE